MAHAANSEALIQTALDARAKVRLLQEAILTDDLHQMAADSRRLVRAYQASAAGLSPQAEADRDQEEDMATHFQIGDTVTHTQGAPAPEPSRSGWFDTFVKSAFLAGSLATGLGIPAMIWSVAPLLLKDRTPPAADRPRPAVFAPAYPGTAYDLEFVH